MAKRKNVIAPNDERSLVAMDKMAAEIKKARELYGDGQPYEEERILDCIVFRYGRSKHEIESMGKYCRWYREEAGHGRFLEGLKRRRVDVRDAYFAMAMVEKFGDEFGTVTNLGVRKARCLTSFTKEEIDIYAKGGPLKDIPHDDVANMTAAELETEVRKLREQQKRTAEVSKERLRQKDQKISDLENEIDHRAPLDKTQKAKVELDSHAKEHRTALLDALAGVAKANRLLNQHIANVEGIDVQMVNEWLNQFDLEMQLLSTAYKELTDFIDEPYLPKLYKK